MRSLVALLAMLVGVAAPAAADVDSTRTTPPVAAAADSNATRDPRPLVDQVIEAYGGKAALANVASYRMDGRIVAAKQGRQGAAIRLFQRPGRLRVELHYPDRPEIRIANGDQGWRGLGDDIEAAEGPMLDAMILQAARADLPLILLEHIADVRSIEPIVRAERTLSGLELPMGHGLTLRAYIDPDTHRIAMSQSSMVQDDNETTFETDYSDFRRVGKVLFGFHEDNFASGTPTGTTTIGKVTLNPKLTPADFGRPPKKTTGT